MTIYIIVKYAPRSTTCKLPEESGKGNAVVQGNSVQEKREAMWDWLEYREFKKRDIFQGGN